MRLTMSKKIIRWIAIIACFAIIIYESINLYFDQKDYKQADEEYKEIINLSITYPAKEDTPEIVQYPLLNIDYDYLKSINPDFIAWLYFPCFDISYPVVKENYVNEYLRVTFDGIPNKAGCLFVDVLSSDDFSGMHDMIFGHNMKNETMFGKLKYLNENEYQEKLSDNPYVYVYTPDNIYQYRVFGYYVTTVGSQSYSEIKNEKEYYAFLDYIKSNSIITFPDEVDLSPEMPLLTLSTCSGKSGSGKRFVIHTVKTNSWDQ